MTIFARFVLKNFNKKIVCNNVYNVDILYIYHVCNYGYNNKMFIKRVFIAEVN